MLGDKIQEAQQTLRLAADMSRTYYDAPLIICYSGGKDSDVLLDIAKRCLNPDDFEVVNNHTTVDAPETVYHIREVFKECNSTGIRTEITKPMFRGKPTSMWKLIVENGVPPTRLARYCCRILKEVAIPNRLLAVGVREKDGEEWLRWWVGEDIKQIRIEDILNEHIESDNGITGNNPG